MSLSHELRQITLGTWWYEGTPTRAMAKNSATPETIQKRAEILLWLKSEGRKVSGIELQKHFELTNSQMWNLVDPLVNAGQIRKFKPRHDRSLLEAA